MQCRRYLYVLCSQNTLSTAKEIISYYLGPTTLLDCYCFVCAVIGYNCSVNIIWHTRH